LGDLLGQLDKLVRRVARGRDHHDDGEPLAARRDRPFGRAHHLLRIGHGGASELHDEDALGPAHRNPTLAPSESISIANARLPRPKARAIARPTAAWRCFGANAKIEGPAPESDAPKAPARLAASITCFICGTRRRRYG